MLQYLTQEASETCLYRSKKTKSKVAFNFQLCKIRTWCSTKLACIPPYDSTNVIGHA